MSNSKRSGLDSVYAGSMFCDKLPEIDINNFDQLREAFSHSVDGVVPGSPGYEYYKPPELDFNPRLKESLASFCVSREIAA